MRRIVASLLLAAVVVVAARPPSHPQNPAATTARPANSPRPRRPPSRISAVPVAWKAGAAAVKITPQSVDVDGRLRRAQEALGGRGPGPVRQGPGHRGSAQARGW